jgi:Uma2 family endonuclease
MSLPIDDAHLPAAQLRTGDHMTRPEFHRLYEQMPSSFKAELLGGTVYVSEPLGKLHGYADNCLATMIGNYRARTPGVHPSNNATVFLSDDDEVQPDLLLRIAPECKGQTEITEDDYIQGAPELVAEIALTSRAIDLGVKRKRYIKAGVLEYIVVCLKPKKLRWFELQSARELSPGDDGVFRSIVFPGLWIHSEALLELDYAKALDVLCQGLATPEHEEFVARLARTAAEE